MKHLRNVFKIEQQVFFYGNYDTPMDPLVSQKDHVGAVAHDVWKVTGYQFKWVKVKFKWERITYICRVKDNHSSETGYKTHYWCCQDEHRKPKSRPSQKENAKHRDTLRMDHYPCKSKMNVLCQAKRGSGGATYTISIWIEHHQQHIPYYDISLPSEAAEIIRENLEWTSPNEIAIKVQMTYHTVTTSQIYNAWTTMSEMLWKRDPDQLSSVWALLGEFGNDVDVLSLPAINGTVQIAWVMKDITSLLQGKIVEVRINATCKYTEMSVRNDNDTIRHRQHKFETPGIVYHTQRVW